MRVLHVSPSVAKTDGGPSEVIRGLVPALITEGIDVDVFATSKGWSPQDDDLEGAGWLHLYPSFGPSSVTFSPALARAVRKRVTNYDLVHVHGLQSHVGSAAMAAARAAGVPYVVEPHGALDSYHWQQHRVRKRVWARLLDRANWRGLSGAVYSSILEEQEGSRVLPAVPAYTWPLGVDESLFEIADWREPADPPVVLYLGRITRKKRLDIVLQAMTDDRLRSLGARLVVAGSPDGTLGLDPLEFSRHNGLNGSVELVGAVDRERRRELLAESSVFVLPSEDESFGVAVAEAMAAGCAVLTSSRVGIAHDAHIAGALVVAEIDAEDVASKLARLLSNRAEAQEMGRRGHAFARERYQWTNAAEAARAAYEAVVRRA